MGFNNSNEKIKIVILFLIVNILLNQTLLCVCGVIGVRESRKLKKNKVFERVQSAVKLIRLTNDLIEPVLTLIQIYRIVEEVLFSKAKSEMDGTNALLFTGKNKILINHHGNTNTKPASSVNDLQTLESVNIENESQDNRNEKYDQNNNYQDNYNHDNLFEPKPPSFPAIIHARSIHKLGLIPENQWIIDVKPQLRQIPQDNSFNLKKDLPTIFGLIYKKQKPKNMGFFKNYDLISDPINTIDLLRKIKNINTPI